jgi:L,D-transpeptidase catalytic domain
MRSATIYVSCLAAALFAASFAFTSSARADIVISIDKSTQQMAVAVDGAQRYVWPVSTGRPGYDTPNGTFKVNRMDADHYSQEWDNAPMPHTMFFDMQGHAVHGFFDVKHLGLAVSHGCVRLSPDNATILFQLVKAEGMANTTVVIGGRTPGGNNGPVAQSRLPMNETVSSDQQQYGQPQYSQPQQQPYYGQSGYGQGYYAQPYYGQPYYGQPYYAQPDYSRPVYRPW